MPSRIWTRGQIQRDGRIPSDMPASGGDLAKTYHSILVTTKMQLTTLLSPKVRHNDPLSPALPTYRRPGAYAILDPHNYMRYNNPSQQPATGSIIGDTSDPNAASSADFGAFWGELASRFVDNEKVIFGLMNEVSVPRQYSLVMHFDAISLMICPQLYSSKIIKPLSMAYALQEPSSLFLHLAMDILVVTPLPKPLKATNRLQTTSTSSWIRPRTPQLIFTNISTLTLAAATRTALSPPQPTSPQ